MPARTASGLFDHHQPASDAAYNREAHMGQQRAFVKGRGAVPLTFSVPGLKGGRAQGIPEPVKKGTHTFVSPLVTLGY